MSAFDIWAKFDKSKDSIAEKKLSDNTETTIVIVGEPASGKSTLIQGYLKPGLNKEIKPTVALEYNFARKRSTTNSGAQSSSIVHFWELGGEINEPKLLEIPITKRNLSNSSVVICVDLSKPGNVLACMQKWTKVVREYVKRLITEIKLSSKHIPSPMMATLAYQEHSKDSTRCRPCEIPLYFICTKYDIFKTLPTAERRSAVQAIRMFAHYHGAAIVTTSTAESSLREHARSCLNAISFPSVGPRGLNQNQETSVEKPLQINAGRDDFETILLLSLSKASGTAVDAKLRLLSKDTDIALFVTSQGLSKDCWNKFSEHLSTVFGPSSVEALPAPKIEQLDDDSNPSGSVNEFPEEAVDQARARQDQALQRYIQEIERREAMRNRMDETDKELEMGHMLPGDAIIGSSSTSNAKTRSSNSPSKKPLDESLGTKKDRRSGDGDKIGESKNRK